MAATKTLTLQGKRIAFLATNGVEPVELTKPWEAVTAAGAKAHLVSLEGDTFPVDKTVDEVMAADYDGLVLPGGVANPDKLRMNPRAVEFTRFFFERGLPVAAIRHGPWLLVEAGVLRGRTVTSYPSLQTDIRNAGGTWVDREVQTDKGLVTSRDPDDLPVFCQKIVEEFAEGVHREQAEKTREALAV